MGVGVVRVRVRSGALRLTALLEPSHSLVRVRASTRLRARGSLAPPERAEREHTGRGGGRGGQGKSGGRDRNPRSNEPTSLVNTLPWPLAFVRSQGLRTGDHPRSERTMRGLRHQPNRSRARCTGHRHGPGSWEQARASRPGGPQLRLQSEATAAAAAAPGDTPAPSEREGWPGCSSRSRGQGATATGANMRSRQVKLEVLARELRLGELEELLRRPLVGEDRLEHQVRQQPILRARALLLSPFFFWAEAAAAHRRSGTPLRHPNGGCLGYAAAVWSAGARLPNLHSGSDRALQPVCTCFRPCLDDVRSTCTSRPTNASSNAARQHTRHTGAQRRRHRPLVAGVSYGPDGACSASC